MYPSATKQSPARGFTLIEVTVAIAILAVGLVALASMVAGTIKGTARSKYMSLAATLASEKLEDLNRWPAKDNNIAVTSGTTAGSLTSDVVQSVTVGATTESVNYFDEVLFASTQGAVSQTVSGLDNSSNVVYTTTTHQPDGTMGSTTSSAATLPANTIAFKRRWLIEQDVPVTGVRRITILVTLENDFVRPPVKFQMTTVRP